MDLRKIFGALGIFVVCIPGSVLGRNIITLETDGSYAVGEWNSSGFSHDKFNLTTGEFPPDIFTPLQRRQGAIILHIIGALYSFGLIGIVCGNYFLPSIDCICSDLNLSQDVAAATFMSFATTAPELFIILIATFITKSDIGVGAVVGSGMFNILGVATIGGLAAVSPIKLDWWPLYRDSLVYLLAPVGLAIVVADDKVTLFESICLISYYFLYFIIMFFNRRLRRKIKSLIKKCRNKKNHFAGNSIAQKPPEKPAPPVPRISLTLDDSKNNDDGQILGVNNQGLSKEGGEENVDNEGSFKAYFINYEDTRSLRRISACSTCSNKSNRSRKKSDKSLNFKKPVSQTTTSPNHLQVLDNLSFAVPALPDSFEIKTLETGKAVEEDTHVCDENEILPPKFFTLPEGSFGDKLSWFILWPANVILHFSVPDCRFEKWRKFYPITFIMCVFWIGISSYFGTWMITVMGDTMGISDSVMGLTFLALGGSMPEAISTFIMARQGEGGLGFSNSLGGNTMDICLCLGVPWLIKCVTDGPVHIKSEGLQYNTLALLIGIVVLLTVATHTKFYMNKRMGIVCCTFYLIFIVVSALIELNIISIEDFS